MLVPLSDWETFYVITGSSGAALTGLMFVVVALAADRLNEGPSEGFGAFSTPTVVHFASVLVLGGIMSVPLHRVWSLTLCLAAGGVAGLYASWRAGRRMRHLGHAYVPGRDDWWWHVISPGITYLALLGVAITVPFALDVALVGVAMVVIALLLIGIHNAWDVAVFLAVQQIARRARHPSAD